MSVSGFTAPPYVAAVGQQGVCAPGDVSAFVTACGNGGSQTMCDSWQNANVASDAGAGTACGNCIIAPMNNGGTWSDVNGYFLPNYGGCIQLTDTTSAGTMCATALDNQQGCEGLACDTCSRTSFQSCLMSADSTGCSQYITAASSACTSDVVDGGAIGTCISSNFDRDLSYVVTLICGSGGTTTDGGTEGGPGDAAGGG
jgi:hypothetical protein